MNTIPLILPNENSKSPFVVTDNVNLDSIKVLDMVKVRLTDKDGNGERTWIHILDMKTDEKNNDTVLSGRIMHDLIVFDFIPKNTVIEVYMSKVVDHLPFNMLDRLNELH